MPNITARFRFYAELNDFLPLDKRAETFAHSFAAKSSVKDIIESLNVPHTEVDLILANSKSINFNYQVKPDELISVYPVFEAYDISDVTHLRPKPLRVTRFILDVHLGKLARYLRLLGFDTLYANDFSDPAIIEYAQKQKRIILTRDVGILKNKKVSHGYWLRETNPKLQVEEVFKRFDLFKNIHAFTRCLECNGKIIAIKKTDKIDKTGKNKKKVKTTVIPPKVKDFYTRFNQCQDCKRIYWEGSHYKKLSKFVEEIASLGEAHYFPVK